MARSSKEEGRARAERLGGTGVSCRERVERKKKSPAVARLAWKRTRRVGRKGRASGGKSLSVKKKISKESTSNLLRGRGGREIPEEEKRGTQRLSSDQVGEKASISLRRRERGPAEGCRFGFFKREKGNSRSKEKGTATKILSILSTGGEGREGLIVEREGE